MNILNKIVSRVSSITAIALLAGCTTPQMVVEPIPAQTPISEICILVNPKVIDPEFLNLVQEGMSRHGLRSTLYRDVPNSCIYVLEYVAFYTWVGKPNINTRILNRAIIKLYQDKKVIGTVSYVLPNEPQFGGGEDPARFKSTKEKLDPLIDELFKYFPSKKRY